MAMTVIVIRRFAVSSLLTVAAYLDSSGSRKHAIKLARPRRIPDLAKAFVVLLWLLQLLLLPRSRDRIRTSSVGE